MSQSIRRRRTGVRPRWRSRPVPTAAGRSRVSARGVGVDGEVGGVDLDGGVVAGGGAGAGLGGGDLVGAGVVDEVDLTVGVAPQVDAGERLADGPPAEGLDPVVKPPEVAVVVEPRREVLVGCPGGGSVGGSVGGSSRNRWVIGPTPSQCSTPGQPPGSSLDLFPGRDGRGGGGSRRPRAELLNRLHRHTSSARTRHRQSRPTSRPWNRLPTNHLDISSCRPRPRPVATGAGASTTSTPTTCRSPRPDATTAPHDSSPRPSAGSQHRSGPVQYSVRRLVTRPRPDPRAQEVTMTTSGVAGVASPAYQRPARTRCRVLR
jgi:hypothetical protein